MKRNISMVEDIQRSLASGGNRWTRPRREVLAVFMRNKMPLTSGEVHKRVQKDGVDLASVYRNIKFFCGQGILVPVDRADEGQRYELSDAHRSHHSHLICNDCGRIEDFDGCIAEGLEKSILKRNRFHVARHEVRFYGVCAGCR